MNDIHFSKSQPAKGQQFRHRRVLILCFLFGLCLTPLAVGFPGGAQRWACSIRGRVTDNNGAVLSGVEVLLRGPSGDRTTKTNESGYYEFNNLQPGQYELRFTAPAFAILRRETSLGANPLGGGEQKVLNVTFGGITTPTPRPTPSIRPTPSPTIGNVNANGNRNSNRIYYNGNANFENRNSNSPNVNARATGASIDDQLNNLLHGKIVYEIPNIMKVGELRVIKIGIAKGVTADVEKRSAKGGVSVEDLKISDTMDVDLVAEEADAFEIRRQQPSGTGPAWQAIGGDQASEWIFNVKPVKSGTHTLKLVATVQLLDSRNQNTPYSFKVYENDIRVSTSYWYYAKEFVGNYWQFLLTAILIPLIPLAVRFWRSTRTPPSPPNWQQEP